MASLLTTGKSPRGGNDPLDVYLGALEAKLKARDATEHTHRPALIALLESLGKKITATNEPKHRTAARLPDRMPNGILTGMSSCTNCGRIYRIGSLCLCW